jgi:outer membrane receptor protein involved in Fe transport
MKNQILYLLAGGWWLALVGLFASFYGRVWLEAILKRVGRNFARIGLALLLLLAAGNLVLAQTGNATIGGAVVDESGAAISGARLTLRGATDCETFTDAQGHFAFATLRKGRYTVVIERAGFKPEQRQVDFEGLSQSLQFTLTPATVNEVINITSSDGAIENFTKLPGSLHETPRALTLLNSEQMRERNLRTVPEALNAIPGMSVNSYRTGGYHFYARGYRMGPEDTRVDGFIGLNVGGGFGASLFGVEQAVVLRGPAGLLYGSTSSPGGLINLITKRPQELRQTRIDVRGGGYAGNGVSFSERPSFSVDLDTTGAFDKNSRILYRGLATLENNNYFTAGTLDRNRYLSGMLTFRLDSLGRYTLTPQAQYARFNRP